MNKSIIEKYQKWTKTTVVYPAKKELQYLIPGLCSEAGEVAGKYKKYVRGDKTKQEFAFQVQDELGDVLWYVSQICNELDLDMETVIYRNFSKLEQRKENDTIKGDGDER